MIREHFRLESVRQQAGRCIVPWCKTDVYADPSQPGEVHHIIERKLWTADHDGYLVDNGVAVCNDHHRMAEQNEIPPQAFWGWLGIDDPPLPETIDTVAVDKWGESLATPPHSDLRQYPKYPSTRHLLPLYWQSQRGTAAERTEHDDTECTDVSSFTGIPLVVTIKMDGSNAMLVADENEPVRARNGRDATHDSFDRLKQDYWDRNVYEALDDRYQVFGENMYAKHSIHYGCTGDDDCAARNQGPSVSDTFLVFGVYDTVLDYWLSWDDTRRLADRIGFTTVPVVAHKQFERGDERALCRALTALAEDVVDQGHEGIIVRSRYPFHYDQFTDKLGKYVRPNHVQTDDHWSHQNVVENRVTNQ